MSDEKTSLTAALRHLAEQERRTPSEHATPGELTAYHEGTLPPAIEARVQEHLAHCKLCSDLLLDLAGFADLAPPAGVPELTDAQVAEDWQALRKKLGQEQAPQKDEKPPGEVVPLRRPSVPKPVKPDRDFSPWKVVAAALLVAAVGLSTWKLTSKQAGPLGSIDQGEISRGEVPEQRMTADQPVDFKFYPPENSSPGYEGRILDEDKTVVWRTTEVKQSVSGDALDRRLIFRVPDNTLRPGRYDAILVGIDGASERQLSHMSFEVDDP